MKKTVIAVCVLGLAAVAAQAQGVARDFNEFGKMYGNNTPQGKRVTGYLEQANRRAASEHAREQQAQQSRPHAYVPATGPMKDWAVFGNLYWPSVSADNGNQNGTQAAPAQPKAKAKPAAKPANGQAGQSNGAAAPAQPKAKQKRSPSAPVTPKAQQKQTLSGPFEKMDEHTWRRLILAH